MGCVIVTDRAHVCDHVNNGHLVVLRAPGIPVVQGQLVLGQPRLHTTFGVMRHLSFVLYIDLVPSQLNARRPLHCSSPHVEEWV